MQASAPTMGFEEATLAYRRSQPRSPECNPTIQQSCMPFQLGQLEKAIEDCNAALNLRPKYNKALLRRADCNSRALQEAKAHLIKQKDEGIVNMKEQASRTKSEGLCSVPTFKLYRNDFNVKDFAGSNTAVFNSIFVYIEFKNIRYLFDWSHFKDLLTTKLKDYKFTYKSFEQFQTCAWLLRQLASIKLHGPLLFSGTLSGSSSWFQFCFDVLLITHL
ncbi:hypothetical protein HPP92_010917 [Vanilla planifolia]|uniref:Uncharacterized protein n=1 Tax=Vanilla planifolia TaxID=51239 RepID=A0A835R0X8_VANPL|nr:hypothetical protein HPP92_010917 [Vanilla planifolia]